MVSGGDDGVLLYYDRFIDPAQDSGMGLWWVENLEDVQAHQMNTVCLSEFHEWAEVGSWLRFIEQWPYVFVASPNREFVETVRRYVRGVDILSPAPNAFQGYDSLAHFAAEHTKSEIDRLLYGAVVEPAYGILEVAKIATVSSLSIPRTLSGLPKLDKYTRGFRQGELSVWTGKRGEGKSSLLGQILLDSIDQGSKVMAYSGELPARQFRAWVLVQAAGPRGVDFVSDPDTGQPVYYATDGTAKLIDEWWAGRFYLTDLNTEFAHDENRIIDDFTYAHRSLGCDVFLVDNIMTARFNDNRDFYRAQSQFAQRLSRFAKANNVHVHLVAHPRKVQNDKAIIDADDISGSGDIPNIADNAFSVCRVPDDKVEEMGCASVVNILKCRETGAKGVKIALDFDPNVKRFWCPGCGGPDKAYGWERVEQTEFTDLGNESVPFEGG